MNGNLLSRSLHDGGLAVWFGGSLAGAIGFNGGAASANDADERTEIASASWAKWAPVSFSAIGAHLLGGVGVIAGNSKRIAGQKGVAMTSVVKIALTGAALGATAYSGVVGKKIDELSPAPTDGVTEPNESTPPELANAQRNEKALQWAVPALTGSLVLLSAYMGEQQRPTSVASGALGRARKLAS